MVEYFGWSKAPKSSRSRSSLMGGICCSCQPKRSFVAIQTVSTKELDLKMATKNMLKR